MDSHTLLWTMDNPPRLSQPAAIAIRERTNDLYISAATIWEISIKTGLKKLNLSKPFGLWMQQAITQLGLDVLPITVEYADVQATLPNHHRDPFDRLMIAQAIVESLIIVSVDPWFDQYNVTRLW